MTEAATEEQVEEQATETADAPEDELSWAWADLDNELDPRRQDEARRALLDRMRKRWEIPPSEMVAKLPKGRKDAPGDKIKCDVCGGWHQVSWVHLDYVGHADVTRILIIEDPLWDWEPMAFDADGLPLMSRTSQGVPVGLWLKLTIFGVTRIGYGSCDDDKSDPEKELIGDGLRNAAMRFGIATKLWSKAEWDGSAEGRTERVELNPPGQAFEDLLTPGQRKWRGLGWPATTDAEALDHVNQVNALRARITAMPEEEQARIREFRAKLNSGAWPPLPEHFDAIVQYLDGLDARATRQTGSEGQEAPAAAAGPTGTDPAPSEPIANAGQPETTPESAGTDDAEAVTAYVAQLDISTVSTFMKLRGIKPIRGSSEDEKRALLTARLITEGWKVPDPAAPADDNAEGSDDATAD